MDDRDEDEQQRETCRILRRVQFESPTFDSQRLDLAPTLTPARDNDIVEKVGKYIAGFIAFFISVAVLVGIVVMGEDSNRTASPTGQTVDTKSPAPTQ